MTDSMLQIQRDPNDRTKIVLTVIETDGVHSAAVKRYRANAPAVKMAITDKWPIFVPEVKE